MLKIEAFAGKFCPLQKGGIGDPMTKHPDQNTTSGPASHSADEAEMDNTYRPRPKVIEGCIFDVQGFGATDLLETPVRKGKHARS